MGVETAINGKYLKISATFIGQEKSFVPL